MIIEHIGAAAELFNACQSGAPGVSGPQQPVRPGRLVREIRRPGLPRSVTQKFRCDRITSAAPTRDEERLNQNRKELKNNGRPDQLSSDWYPGSPEDTAYLFIFCYIKVVSAGRSFGLMGVFLHHQLLGCRHGALIPVFRSGYELKFYSIAIYQNQNFHFLIFTVAKPCLHRHPLRHTWRQDRYIAYICFTFCGWFYHKGYCLSLTDTFSLIQIIILWNGRNIIHSRTSSSDLVVAQAAVNSSLVNIVWSPGQNFQVRTAKICCVQSKCNLLLLKK